MKVKKGKEKKLLAIFLSGLMLFSLFPIGVLAESSYTNVNFPNTVPAVNGSGMDSEYGSANIPEIDLYFESAYYSGSFIAQDFKVFAIGGETGISNPIEAVHWFHIASYFDNKDFDIESFKVYNDSESPQTLKIMGNEEGHSYDLPEAGFNGTDVPLKISTVVINPGWTTVNLSNFNGISSLLIDTPDGSPLYFNSFSIRSHVPVPKSNDTDITSDSEDTIVDLEEATITIKKPIKVGSLLDEVLNKHELADWVVTASSTDDESNFEDVIDKDDEANIVDGDKLFVLAEDGTVKVYTIKLVITPAAQLPEIPLPELPKTGQYIMLISGLSIIVLGVIGLVMLKSKKIK